MPFLQTLHSHAKQVAQAHLGDIVGDVLIVLEVSTSNAGISGSDSDIGLKCS